MLLAEQPLRQAAIEAAGDRVFHPVVEKARTSSWACRWRVLCTQAGRKRLGFAAGTANEWGGVTILIERGHAHLVTQRLDACQVRLQRQHGVGAVQQQAQPVGAVVQISCVDDLLGGDAYGIVDFMQIGGQWNGAGGRVGERQTIGRAFNGDQSLAHSCTMCPACCGCPPCASQAWQVPSVGCPANGISAAGVKMRTW